MFINCFMKAGVDFGSSLVKAVWMNNGNYRFSSTADFGIDELTRQLYDDGVRKINIAGIGYDRHAEYFKQFQTNIPEGDPIQNEINMQADGARQLLKNEGYQGNRFLLVSIGTGTSFAIVTDNETKKFPYGSSIGGGFIDGLGRILGSKSYKEIADESLKGMPLDLRIKDMIPSKAGTFEGELVIANFGKGESDSKMPDVYATEISTVAINTIECILVRDMFPEFHSDDIVYVGSTVSITPLLKKMLQDYSKIIHKNSYFPEHGEFALAIGAYQIE